MKKNFLTLFNILIINVLSYAKIVLPKIFADNMVLQRNVLIPVWGQSNPYETLEIRFHQQLKSIKADKNGSWSVKLEPEIAGGPYQLSIFAKDTLLIQNVLVGEVWLCSGQSNMSWTVGQSQNAQKEIAEANNPFIRHLKIARDISSLPQNDFKEGTWQVCNPSTVSGFSGVGYFFAKNVYEELKIPIGLIVSSWGGTNIETWMSREAFEDSDEFKTMIAGMPKISLDSISELGARKMVQKIEKQQETKLKNINVIPFKDLSYNDANWPELNQPQIWEQQSLKDFDGVVWLRKTIVLTAEDIKKTAILSLCKIDDEDITYMNGVKVGSTNQWDAKRNYPIPSNVLKVGKNVIAIRVVDHSGGGGIFGEPADLKLNLDNIDIPLSGKWKYQVEAVKKGTSENSLPSLAFNAMINPLIPYAFQGVLWYQGESNAGRAFQYRKAFPLLIKDWRQKWKQGDFPFYFVQLATFQTQGNSNEGCGWAELREAQTQTLQLPNTGMCVTTDIGNPKDIHPTNKQTVGKRLSALALHYMYKKPIVCNSPSYKSMEIKDNQIIIYFNNIGTGLFTPDKYGYIKGFEIAGKDQLFYYAQARIQGNTVVVSNEQVKNPMAVHFGWIGDASENNLFNKEGFPVIPFRTDEWKTVTKNEKYTIEKLD
jgi:sialate O-acetylesterase